MFDAPEPGENPALDILAALEKQAVSEEFDLRAHYPLEMAVPGVARICQHYVGIDTMAVHGGRTPEDANDLLIYGDTPAPVLYRLLRRWGIKPTDVFYDLGCGCGMAVFAGALLAKKAVGIDMVARAVDFCRRSETVLQAGNVEFIQADILDVDIREATFIYIASTTFPKEFRQKLRKKLGQCASGTKIVSVTHPMDGDGVKHIAQVPMVFSWSGSGEGFPFNFHFHIRS